jgi:hypothetical protein
VFIKKTRSERISDTVHLNHAHITQPTVTPTDVIVKALQDLTQAIKETPNLKGQEQMNALHQLEMMLVKPVEQALKTSADAPNAAVRPQRVIDTEDEDTQQRPQRNTTRPKWLMEYVNNVFDADSGKILKYRQLLTNPQYRGVWSTSSANEFGRLAQGIGNMVKGTDTIFFIHKHQVPRERMKDVTYVKFVCEVKPNKMYRTRMVVGGDKVNYPDDVSTPTAELLLVKTHVNSVVSTPNA